METLIENWGLVESFGPPIIAVLVVIIFFSSIFYALECKNMSEMEKELKSKGNLDSFEYPDFNFTDPFLMFYIFKFIPNSSSILFKEPEFKAQVNTIKTFRKFYKIIIPIIVLITAIGIVINGTVVSK